MIDMRYDYSPTGARTCGYRAPVILPWGRALPEFHAAGDLVPKPNYHQARKQKELARKARQQEKQQRRLARPSAPGENAAVPAAEAPTVAAESSAETGS